MTRWRPTLLALFASVGFATTAHADYHPVKLDTVHSRLGFEASTLLFDVPGEFERYRVELDGSVDKPEKAKLRVVIETASIDTDNKQRDEHLRKADFFDAKRYPTITFTSRKMARSGDTLKVTGTLDMHGVKRELTIVFKIRSGKNGAGVPSTAYKGTLVIDRTAFGIGQDSVAAKISLEDDVELELLLVTL